jgi:hypothetical protein
VEFISGILRDKKYIPGQPQYVIQGFVHQPTYDLWLNEEQVLQKAIL